MTYQNIDYVSFPPTKDDVYSHKYHYDKSVNNINNKKIQFTLPVRSAFSTENLIIFQII